MPTRVKGKSAPRCYPCSRRRINCDRTEPQCQKCVRVNIECPGLGVRYRWASPVQAAKPKKRARRPSGAQPGKTNHKTVELSGSNDPANNKLLGANTVPTIEEQQMTTGNTAPKDVFKLSLSVTPTSRPDQWVINYFVANISQWIYPTRSVSNEFDTLLAPFTSHSPEVFAAIAAASYHHLACYGNEDFTLSAERYKSAAINGLLNNANNISGKAGSRNSQLTAVAVIVVMIYDDMITAQNNFRYLIRIMKTLLKLVDFELLEADRLGQFLTEQIGLVLILCLPYFEINNKDREMVDQALQFVDRYASRTDRHRNASFLAFCFRQSICVWSQSMAAPGTNVDSLLEDLKVRLQRFDDLDDIDHYLTWVYFNCAAAATHPDLRQFFSTRLGQHAKVIKFKNMPLMLDFLEQLWKDGKWWSATLHGHSDYICA